MRCRGDGKVSNGRSKIHVSFYSNTLITYLGLLVRHEPGLGFVVGFVVSVPSFPLAGLFVINQLVFLPFRHALHFGELFEASLGSRLGHGLLARQDRRRNRQLR